MRSAPGACVPSFASGRLPLLPPVVCTRGAPFRWRSPNRALWAGRTPLVGLQWRSPPRGGSPSWAYPVAPPAPSRAPAPRLSQQNPPLRQQPCLSPRSAIRNSHLLGGRAVCLPCRPSQFELTLNSGWRWRSDSRKTGGGGAESLADALLGAEASSAQLPGIFRGIKRKRKPLGCGENGLVQQAPSQKSRKLQGPRQLAPARPRGPREVGGCFYFD